MDSFAMRLCSGGNRQVVQRAGKADTTRIAPFGKEVESRAGRRTAGATYIGGRAAPPRTAARRRSNSCLLATLCFDKKQKTT